jgi:hypothetical protein
MNLKFQIWRGLLVLPLLVLGLGATVGRLAA